MIARLIRLCARHPSLGQLTRLADVDEPCDWTRAQSWQFHPLDDDAFPAGRLARHVGEGGGTFPAVYNAANEVCVDAFHDGTIRFTDIVDTVGRVVEAHTGSDLDASSVEGVLAADRWARRRAAETIGATSAADTTREAR